ncbi:MAG: PQQ-dependent sugar dehydrogenase [Propionibacteriaceae bacterium]|nr:PQQ-dependent sugar dehydrogenase [Propionibacteriaceae bacterium]
MRGRGWLLVSTLAFALIAGCSAPPVPNRSPSPPAATAAPTSPSAGTPRTLASHLDVPWDLAVLPDGDLLITLRDAADVVRLGRDGQVTTVAHIAGVVPGGEGGLLGLTLSPDFASDGFVYVYYTAADDNRVVRYRYAEATLSQPHPILTGIPKGGVHNGGRLRFGPDGDLYIGTGETGNSGLSQNTRSLGGKILRIHADGSIPSDNPFGNAVYSYGHRNVQGLGWDARGRLYASEFGASAEDELNEIVRGGNYGWPVIEGDGQREGMRPPLLTWRTSEASPSGIAVTPDGTVYLAALRGERVWKTTRNGDAMTDPVVFADGFGRVRDVEIVGSELYLLTDNTFRGSPSADDDRLIALPLG